MRSHGSGQFCYQARAAVKCEDCKRYLRERQMRDYNREGTYRWAQGHDPHSAAWRMNGDNARRHARKQATALDKARLARLIGGDSAEAI